MAKIPSPDDIHARDSAYLAQRMQTFLLANGTSILWGKPATFSVHEPQFEEAIAMFNTHGWKCEKAHVYGCAITVVGKL